ncbi:MAG: TonB-dependent receptor [Gemmatimonadales bacterium]|nr:MAG: TonB-dependent receptor [Gemmatimonadales bacterium]
MNSAQPCCSAHLLSSPFNSSLLSVVLALAAATVLLLAPAELRAHFGDDPSGSITGTVLDAETGEPLPSARVTVRLPSEPDEMVASTTSRDGGVFRVDDLEPGEYLVEFGYIGYREKTLEEVRVEPDEATDLGELSLAVEAVALEALEVDAPEQDVRVEADRTVYRVDGMPAVGGGSALDAMGAVPELDVEFDGSVSFEGQTPQIYVNGRPAPVDGESLDVFLEQFPADLIESVEVIPNPSARFDAEGAGGIVNIVLRQDVELGLTGSAFLNAGTRGQAGGGSRVSWQRGDLVLQGGFNVRHTDRTTENADLRQNLVSDPTFFTDQERVSNRSGLTGGVDLAAEYALSRRLDVWSRVRVDDLGRSTDGTNLTNTLDADESFMEQVARVSDQDRDRVSGDARLGMELDLAGEDEADHELGLEVRWDGRNDDRISNVYSWTREDPLDVIDFDPDRDGWDQWREDDRLEQRSRVRVDLDYVRPVFGEVMMEAGLQTQLRDTDNERERRIWGPDGLEEATPTGFDYRQRSHSAYVTAARSLGNVSLQLGLRAEMEDNTFTLPGQDAVDTRQTSFFPTLNMNWRTDGGMQYRISYSQRVRRPWPGRLNPLDTSNDPLTRRVGNPELEPQTTHSVRAEARWSGELGQLRFTPFMRYTTDEWARIRNVDGAGVATETWENLNTSRQLGASLQYRVRDVAGMSGSLRVSGRQDVREDLRLDVDTQRRSVRWSVRGDVSRDLTDRVSAQTRVSYSPSREVAQGWVSSNVTSRVGIRARILDGRGRLNVMVRDPLGMSDQSFESRNPTHVQIGSSREGQRSATVSLSYQLGSPGRRR